MARHDDAAQPEWSAQDLAEMLRHQLGLRVGDAGGGGVTVGRLLSSALPSLADLQWVKLFAKDGATGGDGPPPPQISAVLYYGAISTAFLRLGTRISNVDDGQMLRGLDWVLDQQWLDEATRQLFEQMRGALRSKLGIG